MFIENKYYKCYFSIVNNAKAREVFPDYVEKHHIIPKSLGGDDSLDNIVSLSGKEHFICHKLLPKFLEGENRTKMVYAIWIMCHSKALKTKKYKITARYYATIKEQMKNGRTSADFTPEWRAKLSASRKGKSSWNKGIPRSAEVKAAVSKANKGRITKGFSGRTHSEETKKKISEAFARKRSQ